jgi:hypothetical protein
MAKRFTLTPTLENILVGRGMKLICCAPHCLHETGGTDDQKFERGITWKGYGKCPRCGFETPLINFSHLDVIENRSKQYKSHKDETIPKCEQCGALTKAVFTQEVVSKHRKVHHYYYHAECYDAIFIGENGEKLFTKKVHKMRYAGSGGGGCIITLPFDPRKGVCESCGKSKHKFNPDGTPEIKLTSLHHWKYAYTPETVKNNPILILDNTSEFCFACHQVADGLRGIMKLSPERALKTMKKMPEEMQEKFLVISKLFSMWKNENT